MKNSETHARTIKKLLGGTSDKPRPSAPEDLIELMVRSVFEENASAKQADEAMANLAEEFVDRNELRVSPIKDICECVGRDYPNIRAKAHAVTGAMRKVFDRVNMLSLDYLAKKPKREIRRSLRDDLGLSLYAESVVTMVGFGGHAVPVDDLLLDALKLDGCIDPDSDLPDLQGFLERIVSSKNDLVAHEALRAYAAKAIPVVTGEWARREKIRLAAEAKAKAEAEAKAKAKAEAEAEAARKAERAAKAKVAKKARAARAKAAKKTKAARAKAATRKAAPKKTAKKTTAKKPAAKKAVKKTVKKAGEKRK